jgi:hypothetical protein
MTIEIKETTMLDGTPFEVAFRYWKDKPQFSITFESKPSEEIRDEMKLEHFWWNKWEKFWMAPKHLSSKAEVIEALSKMGGGRKSMPEFKLTPKGANDIDLETIFDEASIAGMTAGNNHTPAPMTITDGDLLTGKPIEGAKVYNVPQGVVGFAWIVIRPGTSKAAKFAVKHYGAGPHHAGGVSIWVTQFDQCYERKVLYAQAFVRVLSKYGIKASSGDRLD